MRLFLVLLLAVLLVLDLCVARRKRNFLSFLLLCIIMSFFRFVYIYIANKVPPESESNDDEEPKECDPKAVFAVNCYQCFCNRLGTFALCNKMQECDNPKAPPFKFYP